MGLICDYRVVLRCLHISKPTPFSLKVDKYSADYNTHYYKHSRHIGLHTSWKVFGPFFYVEFNQNIDTSNMHSGYQMTKDLIGIWVLYNWLIWRVLKLVVFFKKEFSLYLFWRLEQSEQHHLYVDIFLCDRWFGVDGHSPKNAKLKTTPN